jgi:CelD/BcsL family acetyltransferase involved in cellulose biosynthesis
MPDTNALLRSAWDFLTDTVEADLVSLPKVRADAVVAPLMAELAAIPMQRRLAPYLQHDPVSAPSSVGSHKNRRGRKKRLAKLGTVTGTDHSGDAQAGGLAARTVELKRAQLKERGVLSPALTDRRTEEFFSDAAMGLGDEAGVRVFELLVNGEPAASAILVDCKDHVIAHITAFDARFEKGSVGMLVLEQSIQRAFEAGYRTFDLLPPADGYKMRWAHGTVEVTDWAVATSLKGAMFARFYLALARPAVKASFRVLPLALRRLVVSLYSG